MTDALKDHEGAVSIGSRTITNFCFDDDIDGLAGVEEELAILAEHQLMTNNTSGINSEIKVNGQKFETVTNLQYLCSVITNEGSKPEILSMIAQTIAALTKLGLTRVFL